MVMFTSIILFLIPIICIYYNWLLFWKILLIKVPLVREIVGLNDNKKKYSSKFELTSTT